MSAVLRWSIVAAGLFATSQPANADDVSQLTAKLGTAAAAVTSFVVEMQVNGTTGVSGTMTFVRPLRMKSEFSVGRMSMETYLVDGTLYVRSPVKGWQKTKMDALRAQQPSLNVGSDLKAAEVKLLPDRRENGMTVGVVQLDRQMPSVGQPAQPAAQELICSYDKTTYRMRSCSNSFMTMTYGKYNDPANVVTLPADAQSATPMVLPAPASPDPAPTASATMVPLPVPTASP